MFEEIKAIAYEAKIKLKAKNDAQDQNLPVHALFKLYDDLLELIKTAEEQQATAGLWLLSRQLINGCEKINALELGIHYLNVLKYQQHSIYPAIKSHDLFVNVLHTNRYDIFLQERKCDTQPYRIDSAINILRMFTQINIDMLFVFQFSVTAFVVPVAALIAGASIMRALYSMAGIALLFGLSHYFDEPYIGLWTNTPPSQAHNSINSLTIIH